MKYVKGSLFTAPMGEVLIHSCNTYGKWGAGIAVQFRQRYPEAHDLYVKTCMQESSKLLGKTQLTGCNGHIIGSLFVSKGYGWYKDPEEEIFNHTRWALADLAQQILPLRTRVHMPKINSGLFKVPWEKTEELVRLYLEPATAGVVVYEL
jgi:ADP-ribose 1''-phosphate phosphatase